MRFRIATLIVLLAGLALTLGVPRAPAASRPPIPLLPPAGETPPPSGATVDSREPITPCGEWYLQSAYGDSWGTDGQWWEYSCPGPVGAIDGDDPFWTDFYYWDGTQSVFYGQMYWQYDYWLVGGYCAYWWDEATGAWYDPWGCTEPPTASFSHSCSGLSCDFDGGASSDTDGTIVAYDWSFDDGTLGSGATVHHTFAQAGTYFVILTVQDDLGWQGATSTIVTVTSPNVPPNASFSFACSGMTCSLNGTASSDSDGTIVSHVWDFGDGAAGSGASTQHVYAQPGTYTVTLTVTDDHGGSATVSKSVVATPNAPPLASFASNCTGLSCTFNGSESTDRDGSIVAYHWSFGDGTSGTGATVQHTFGQTASYTVTLTVTDDDAAVDDEAKSVILLALTATGQKVKGVQNVILSWTGTSVSGFDVYRNGSKIAAVGANSYSDNINAKGAGSYVYKVCATSTSICSNSTTVSF